jgi:hypothetical protein
MQVGPVDWDKFQSAMEWGRAYPATGRSSARVYRSQEDPSRVMVVEEWDSHDSMHNYQEQLGDEFNRRAGTEGLDWQTGVWEIAQTY